MFFFFCVRINPNYVLEMSAFGSESVPAMQFRGEIFTNSLKSFMWFLPFFRVYSSSFWLFSMFIKLDLNLPKASVDLKHWFKKIKWLDILQIMWSEKVKVLDKLSLETLFFISYLFETMVFHISKKLRNAKNRRFTQ